MWVDPHPTTVRILSKMENIATVTLEVLAVEAETSLATIFVSFRKP